MTALLRTGLGAVALVSAFAGPAAAKQTNEFMDVNGDGNPDAVVITTTNDLGGSETFTAIFARQAAMSALTADGVIREANKKLRRKGLPEVHIPYDESSRHAPFSATNFWYRKDTDADGHPNRETQFSTTPYTFGQASNIYRAIGGKSHYLRRDGSVNPEYTPLTDAQKTAAGVPLDADFIIEEVKGKRYFKGIPGQPGWSIADKAGTNNFGIVLHDRGVMTAQFPTALAGYRASFSNGNPKGALIYATEGAQPLETVNQMLKVLLAP